MAHFLRDERVSNVTIDEDAIKQLDAAFKSRWGSVPEQAAAKEDSPAEAFLSYVIRFDGAGNRVFTLDSLLNHFRQAIHVERILFTLETGASLRSNRVLGRFLELRPDAKDPNGSLLVATSDVGDWVDTSFSAVRTALARHKNRNYLGRSTWTHLAIQLLGVALGFSISLWAGAKLAPYLRIENAFLIAFFLALLLFSNLWTPAVLFLHQLVDRAFPAVRFFRPSHDRMQLLLQMVVSGVVGAVTLYLLGLVLSYAGQVLGGFVAQPPG